MVGVVFIQRIFRRVKEDTSTFLGIYNTVIISILLLLIFWILGWTDVFVELLPNWAETHLQGQLPDTGKLLVLLTAAYVLTSFNEMREARKNRRNHEASPVLPHFENDEAWEFKVPKLHNFGSSPAVMFQLLAQVEGIDGGPKIIRRIKSFEDPVNLDPEKSLVLMEDELANMLKKSNGWSDDAELKLYYGFDSIHGGDAPHALGLSKSLNDLKFEYPNPKSIKMQELQACFDESSNKSPTEE